MRSAIVFAVLCSSAAAADEPKKVDPAPKAPAEAPRDPKADDPRALMKELGKAKRLDRVGQGFLAERTVAEYEITQLTADVGKLLADDKVKKACELLDDPARLAALDRVLALAPAERAEPYAAFLKEHGLDGAGVEAANVVFGLRDRAAAFRGVLRVIDKEIADHEKKAVTDPPLRLPSVAAPRGLPDADAILRRYSGGAAEANPKPPEKSAVPDLEHIRRKAAAKKEP